MSDNKKYYYLKLVDNFYERDEMIMLESMPDGYMYSNILLKLYLRSLKNNGKLMFNNRIPYNSTMLANVTRFPVAVVEKAIAIFKELGLIEVLDNGAIYVLDIQNFIGQSSTEADRKREYRNKIEEEKKALGQTSGHLSDKTPPEKEIEKEIELDIEPPHIKKEKSMVVEASKLITNYFPLEKNEVLRIIKTLNDSKKDMNYLEEKLNYVKNNPNTRDVVGLLINAIKNDYKSSMSNNSYKKTRFHNFDENFLDGMSEEDFNDLVSGHK